MYDSQKKVGKSVRTAIVKKTLNPVWKEPEPVV
jgi:Ca2+-dependent lipid-binding protein